jgi:hypothetical protein
MNNTVRQQGVTTKTIALPAEVKRKLSIRAINAGTNLKNYIEMVCLYLSEHGEFNAVEAQEWMEQQIIQRQKSRSRAK